MEEMAHSNSRKFFFARRTICYYFLNILCWICLSIAICTALQLCRTSNLNETYDTTNGFFFSFSSIWFCLRVLFAAISIKIFVSFFDYEIENRISTNAM